VLMNTAGNHNRDLPEPRSLRHRFVIGLLRLLVPPHPDNEQAAEFLRTEANALGAGLEWAAVRPDGLVDHDAVTGYEVHASPTRCAIFDAGKSSRHNVAHFMADLAALEGPWSEWRGQMPVIYNRETQE